MALEATDASNLGSLVNLSTNAWSFEIASSMVCSAGVLTGLVYQVEVLDSPVIRLVGKDIK
jgi:hypothetical protein